MHQGLEALGFSGFCINKPQRKMHLALRRYRSSINRIGFLTSSYTKTLLKSRSFSKQNRVLNKTHTTTYTPWNPRAPAKGFVRYAAVVSGDWKGLGLWCIVFRGLGCFGFRV